MRSDTHSEHVILTAFPLLQWLRERTSILRLYVHYLVCNTEGLYRLRNLVFYQQVKAVRKRSTKMHKWTEIPSQRLTEKITHWGLS